MCLNEDRYVKKKETIRFLLRTLTFNIRFFLKILDIKKTSTQIAKDISCGCKLRTKLSQTFMGLKAKHKIRKPASFCICYESGNDFSCFVQMQSLERDIDAFRKKLHVLPTIRDEGEGGVLDEELESLEAKFKDISRECAKQMDRLSSLAKDRKTFDELNDK